MTCAVCDSGPLTHLWQIGLWPALGTFQTLHIAEQVAHEVREHVALDRLEELAGCALHVHAVSEQEIRSAQSTLPPEVELQPADLATLALTQRLAPDLVLTDDLSLRRVVEV